MEFDSLVERGRERGWSRLPLGRRVVAIGKEFLGTPYVGGTLDRSPGKEECTVLLDGLDCVTFFETSLALARVLVLERPSWDALVAEVAATRYRRGAAEGYASRLHYTSDWILTNAARGLVADATRTMPGAEPWTKKIGFMSGHRDRYPALADPAVFDAIRDSERALSEADRSWIPKEAVPKAAGAFRSGDIFGLVTGVEGLDCAHTGLCAGDGAGARLMHASSSQGKVVLDRPIVELVAASRSWTGIVVARPQGA
ncbi:MAG: DUF1460 domain-containing protein [Fimbriimonadaceae bacterium]|nr:DUF1460 domain-containing protein [Chthonomonadaceae bacterium]MCO5295303.1 DUF1460 domain-containing protein [Fimbriimonadaceae bacterium]